RMFDFVKALGKYFWHASTIVFPVIRIRFGRTPSPQRFTAEISVGQKHNSEQASAITLLTSSGIDRSKLRSPASTCANGVPIFLAVIATAATVFVSPSARTMSGS